MPRLNFSEPPVQSDGTVRGPCSLTNDEVVRLSSLSLTTLEVAHDLRNLLQIASSAICLIDRNLEASSRAALDPIISGALTAMERAATLSRRILDSSRPRPFDSPLVYLDTLLTELRTEIDLAVGPAVRTVVQLGDYIPPISCHRADLENVILNLVVNARDAMPAGGTLTLSVERDSSAASPVGSVVLTVADTGCGMAQSVAAHAFKPFFTTKPRGLGSGLGLALVRAFAGRIGGSATIASAVGQGSTIILRLPSSRR